MQQLDLLIDQLRTDNCSKMPARIKLRAGACLVFLADIAINLMNALIDAAAAYVMFRDTVNSVDVCRRGLEQLPSNTEISAMLGELTIQTFDIGSLFVLKEGNPQIKKF